MASALLAQRNEPHWGERKVYMRKATLSNPNPNPKLGSNPNPNPKLGSNPNPNPKLGSNPNPNPNYRTVDHAVDYANPTPIEACAMDSDELPATALSDDCSSFNLRAPPPGPGAGGGYVRFDISGYSRREVRELKRRLVSELEQVRSVVSRIDSLCALHSSKASHPGPKVPIPMQPAVGPASEKLLATMMKRCGGILTKLMKHKGGVWFNAPVDVDGMGLHDYHQIIKNPMDLGTVKNKLNKGVYGTPSDFASDIRLTFNNALRYNPPGHEVNKLAGQLLRLFEGLFQPAYEKYEKQRDAISREGMIVEEMQRRHHHQQQQQQRSLPWPRSPVPEHEPRGESMRPEPVPVAPPLAVAPTQGPGYARQQQQQLGAAKGVAGRLPKPKARDQNKRAMSFEEKQKLSIGLQSLPPEKMEQVLHIVRRRNGMPTQHGDEIELDFELMDNETLWELDRFLCNCKKMMSKIKRQEALAGLSSSAPPSAPTPVLIDHGEKQSPMAREPPEAAMARKNKRGEAGDEDVDIGDEVPSTNYPPVEIDKDAGYASSSSSSGSDSSSSSSGSGSGSSSDSDSDEDVAQSPAVG